jgi:hypothetical protein
MRLLLRVGQALNIEDCRLKNEYLRSALSPSCKHCSPTLRLGLPSWSRGWNPAGSILTKKSKMTERSDIRNSSIFNLQFRVRGSYAADGFIYFRGPKSAIGINKPLGTAENV